jgi:UDP-N-acetylmuramoyl-L-alanyl-D-glutamate--2,6-diaminopimelate ligase
MEKFLLIIKKIIPKRLFHALQPTYHYILSVIGASIYNFPGKELCVIAVTGTKGKSSVVEIINRILEEARYNTAVSNTLRFKIANDSVRNMYKMTTPGRFFLQKFMRKAVRAGCTHLVVEVTSQAVLHSRHKFLFQDALVFTNLSPEHIESHGSYEYYVNAKLKIADELVDSPKKNKIMVVNTDEKESPKFLERKIENKFKYNLKKAKPYTIKSEGIDFTFNNKKMSSPLSGEINLYNLMAGATLAKAFGISEGAIASAISGFDEILGRVQKIQEGQNFDVIVDYAHTIDSLEKFYKIFGSREKICILGNTGGGRDKWKRPKMAKVAEDNCSFVILTNEDPYDEDPMEIINQMAEGIENKEKLEIIGGRRAAIRKAIEMAKEDSAVLVTGKGTDPYIMGADGSKQEWDDATVCAEELRSFLGKQNA